MIYLMLLGNPVVSSHGKPLRLRDRKGMALIAYLAVEGESSRDKLADLLWADRDQTDARRNLRQKLYELKPHNLLETDGEQVRLAGTYSCDFQAFQNHIRAGEDEAAIALARGPFLDGLELEGAEDFMTWCETTRTTQTTSLHEALRRVAQTREAAGDLRGALEAHQHLLREDELQEFHQREAMRLLEQLGEREAALQQYERYRSTLEQELGDVPLPETQALAERLRAKGNAKATSDTTDAAAHLNLHPPLIGRETEWQRIREHPNHLALIVGEPGIGKTRLASEFAQANAPTRTLRGREGSSGSPLYPVAETIRQALTTPDWVPTLEPIWRNECARLVPEMDPDNPAPAPPASLEGRVRFLEGLARALEASVNGTGTLLLDDLHWFDAASLELVAHLTRRTQTTSVRLIATARAQELTENTSATPILSDLKREGALCQINLEPLQERDVRGIVQALTQGHDAPRFAQRLHTATTGNPFFLLETLRDLHGAGTLRVMANGTWTTPFDTETDTYAELPIPTTVRDTVLSRADRTGAATRRLLEAASLAGDGFDLGLISSATALSEWEGVDAIERAVQAELLYPLEHGYRFNHDLTRRSLEDALNPDRRKLIHRKLAVNLEGIGGLPDRIAEHYEQGGLPRQAAPWRVRAGEAATQVYAYEQALSHYEKALKGISDWRKIFDVRKSRARLCKILGDIDSWKNESDEMYGFAKKYGDDEDLAEAYLENIEILAFNADFHKLILFIEETGIDCASLRMPDQAYRFSIYYFDALEKSGYSEKAEQVVKEALNKDWGTDNTFYGRLCINASNLYLSRNNLDMAEKYQMIAENSLNNHASSIINGQCLFIKAMIYEKKGIYREAKVFYQSSKKVFEVLAIKPAIEEVGKKLIDLENFLSKSTT